MMAANNAEREFLAGSKIGGTNPPFFIAGPCVIESAGLLQTVAKEVRRVADAHQVTILFKSSFDKANRSSIDSFRGPGIREGLQMLKEAAAVHNLPTLTDIHSPEEAEIAAEYVDMLQIPAFLCRQTDLVVAAARTGKWTNIKKGQFVAPEDALQIADKFRKSGSDKVTLCERGYTFGYNNLVVDMRAFEIMRSAGLHVVFDATHSTQLPGGGKTSGGDRRMAFPLMRAAVAVGLDGIFAEIHPNPPEAKSDATNQLYLKDFENFVQTALKIDRLVKADV
ncbi:3-deoxy-8-phosphooctulonate synthase [Turneriella parva]|uniref:3-deoxy-8-phosphooctulonate synthase n=1 Tax=Turneriella parva (strain ATCC BAA-1111 / DSM 21527 / NCTC 11395 / H) TaxID=869212 RepID=I4BBF2_TURPD|nr:3-deoxy-8-phosphooctulonate synthase [Turneriella parva]AFM14609.1 2-dehydro-3-deoxyphosphooctonate aldolase [Turneriella parva DSM 21527]